jgi:hypothetical protein
MQVVNLAPPRAQRLPPHPGGAGRPDGERRRGQHRRLRGLVPRVTDACGAVRQIGNDLVALGLY